MGSFSSLEVIQGSFVIIIPAAAVVVVWNYLVTLYKVYFSVLSEGLKIFAIDIHKITAQFTLASPCCPFLLHKMSILK